jgi:hypothetical protein
VKKGNTVVDNKITFKGEGVKKDTRKLGKWKEKEEKKREKLKEGKLVHPFLSKIVV